jgi:hypothetical protein
LLFSLDEGLDSFIKSDKFNNDFLSFLGENGGEEEKGIQGTRVLVLFGLETPKQARLKIHHSFRVVSSAPNHVHTRHRTHKARRYRNRGDMCLKT